MPAGSPAAEASAVSAQLSTALRSQFEAGVGVLAYKSWAKSSVAEADDAEAFVKFTVTPAAAKAVSTMEAADDLRRPFVCGEFEEEAAFKNFVNLLLVVLGFFAFAVCVST